jgi:hypothetical protein
MKGRLWRVGVIATAVALAVAGSITSSAVADPAGPRDGAAAVETLRTTLQDAANAGDVKATQATLDQLETLLTDIEGGQRYAVSETSRDLAATAGEETATAQQEIADAFADQGAKEIPSVAELLNVLLQRVLLALGSLLTDLLGPSLPIA